MLKINCFVFFYDFLEAVCQLVYTRYKPSHIHPKQGRLAKVLYRFIISQIYKIISNNRKTFLQ